MNFLKFKISFLILLMIFAPIVTAKVFFVPAEKNNFDNVIKVYDIQKAKIIEMKTEDYIAGVVSAEMPADFHPEALKAQAVAARTYLSEKGACQKYEGADICTDSSHCQAYKSVETLKQQWGDDFARYYNKICTAVYDTKGEILLYDGEPISAVFHSTSSGRTQNSSDVWGNSVPYLVSVESPLDKLSPRYASSVTISLEDFKAKIKNADSNADFDNYLISDIHHTSGGMVESANIGGVLFSGTEIRNIFALNSASFNLDIIGDDVVFDVRGYGHGVGMSQYGANYMAESGSDYQSILKKYYTGAYIGLY